MYEQQIAERSFEGFYNSSDDDYAIALVDELIADHFVDHSPQFGSSPDKAGKKRTVALVRTAFKQHFMVEKYVVQAPMVVGIWHSSVIHHGDFLGIPATGKQFVVRGITAYEIIDGQIVGHWEQFDQVGIMRELDLLSTQVRVKP